MSRKALGAAAATLLWMLAQATAAFCDLTETVRRPDPAYRWQIVRSDPQAIEAEVVSQQWRGAPWTHALRVVRPAVVRHPDLAVLIVGGDGRREYVDEAALATAAGVVVARLPQVPNQPLFRRSEDELIAYTFEQFMKSEDPDWPLLVPMTRAAVRAMDAVGEITAREWQSEIRRFVVTGASKRGWTSWLAGATDPRVVGIAPVVFDNLNFAPQMKNQRAVWGAYSPEIGDYTERALPALVDTEPGRKLLALVDPYSYLGPLARVSKLIVNGSNDPYWELGAVHFYWSDLRGEKSLLEIPNAGHGAGSDGRVLPTLAAFVERVAAGQPMPELRWSGPEPSLALTSGEEPSAVAVWTAQAPSRDFRAARWRRVAARRQGERYIADVAELASPASARPDFVALFGEAQYAAPSGAFTLSTPVRILAPTPGP